MKTKQKIAVPILADREVFDYLKEKVGERKQRQKPSVIYWINLWQVLFPLFKEQRLRTSTQPVPRDCF